MSPFRGIATVIATAAAVLVAAPVMAGPADALTKDREPLPLTQNLLLEGFCDFPVLLNDLSGSPTQTLVFDDAGNLLRIEVRGHLVSQFTNVETGESVTVNNSGPVTIYPQADGSYRVVQRGQSVSADQGLITGESQLIHHTGRLVTVAVPNPETGFVDFVSQERKGHTTDLCNVLSRHSSG